MTSTLSTTRSDAPKSSKVEHRRRTRAQRSRATADLLARAHAATDPEARKRLLDEVVLVNRGVAEAVAARYRRRGVPQEDLEQAALEGLVKAVNKFDPALDHDLLTYAVPTIRGEVQRYFRDQSWMIRPPRRLQELQWKLSRTAGQLSQELGREPTATEIIEALDVSAGEYREALNGFGCFHLSSLDQPFADSGLTLGDSLAAEDRERERAEVRATLAPALARLAARDRRILYLRFVEDRTQQSIGEELGISQMQVSRLLDRILRDLRVQITVGKVPAAS